MHLAIVVFWRPVTQVDFVVWPELSWKGFEPASAFRGQAICGKLVSQIIRGEIAFEYPAVVVAVDNWPTEFV